MAHSAAAMLRQTAFNRKPRVVGIQKRIARFDLLGRQHFCVCTIENHCITAPDKRIALRVSVDQVENAALADHGVEIKILLKPLPEF